MAATQRITGGDEPAWPDERTPGTRSRRRRWPWLVAAVLSVLGVAWFVASREHHRVDLSDGLSCRSSQSRSTVIDYSWTSGPSSPEAALDAFLHSVHVKGLPTSGYTRPGTPQAHPVGGVTPSVGPPFDYVHQTHGRVDVGLRLEKSGGIWEVSEVETCT